MSPELAIAINELVVAALEENQDYFIGVNSDDCVGYDPFNVFVLCDGEGPSHHKLEGNFREAFLDSIDRGREPSYAPNIKRAVQAFREFADELEQLLP